MHQFLSSLLSIFLSPFNWIIILLLAAWLFRKKKVKKVLIILSICIFIIFGNHYLLNLFANNFQPKRVNPQSLAIYSCGIVPGGFASTDTHGDGFFNSAADRFIQAVKLYKLGKVTHLLISGGNGKNDVKGFKEGAFVKTQLNIFGVPDSVVFVEDRSTNTKENAVNSKIILDSLHLSPPYLLITSAFHMPRAALTFKKSGLAVDPFPCNYTEGMDAWSWDDVVPRFSVLMDWGVYLKESAGYLWYKL
ncbi:MAG: YdcF family protein [Ginsengibacter sp.]